VRDTRRGGRDVFLDLCWQWGIKMMAVKVLLDTDVGSDIDDAFCLAYLLAQPRCELLGITTVTGEADKRAMLASALCRVAARDIPIYPGAERPLFVPQKQPHAPQAKALTKWVHDDHFVRGEAVEFLRHAIRAHPGAVVLLAIGPLTNIGLLFAVDPDVPGLLKGLVIMAGVFADSRVKRHEVEWNASCDPHAAALVYAANVRPHRSIGLDVSQRVAMHKADVFARCQAPLLQVVRDFAGEWDHDTITFHDPLAAATIFDDGICRFERGTVDVGLASRRALGPTHFRRRATEGRHEVAMAVDVERFFEHYFSVF